MSAEERKHHQEAGEHLAQIDRIGRHLGQALATQGSDPRAAMAWLTAAEEEIADWITRVERSQRPPPCTPIKVPLIGPAKPRE